jgi:hypothetical protein
VPKRRKITTKRKLSEAERQRRAAQRAANRQRLIDGVAPLLYSRAQTARRLSCSIASVIRLEREGRLTVVRLRDGGDVHHHCSQVDALAGVGS